MVCVGREKETQRVVSFLDRGCNVIVTGRYGIGRTSLIRKVASISPERWQFIFVDFSQTPLRITKELLMRLQATRKGKRQIASGSYRILRNRLLDFDFKGLKRPVLVLDNIAALSAHKLALLRHLNSEGNKFLFVAIVEWFIRDRELFLLRAQMMPVEMIRLSYLDPGEAGKYFQAMSERHNLRWSEAHIGMLVESIQGYPLGMVNAVQMAVDRHQTGNDRNAEE